jgi:oligosaccharide repeat unit polymerase
MSLVAAVVLLVLAVLNRSLSRSWAYPPCVFCCVWGFALLLLSASGDVFYPIGPQSILFFVLGAFAFSVGGGIALALPFGPIPLTRRESPHRTAISFGLDIGLVLLTLCFPLYLRYMEFAGSLASTNGNNSAEQLRRGSMTLANDPNRVLRFEPSLVPLAIILGVLAFNEYRGGSERRWRTYAMIAFGFLYTYASAARSEIIVFLSGLIAVVWIRRGKLPARLLVGATALFLVIFTVNQISLEKMGTNANASLSDNLPALSEGLLTYSVGSIVAFDHYVQNPGSIKNGSQLMKPIARIINQFGGHMDEPSRHLMFTKISSTQETNVYSIYFPFYDDGYVISFLDFMILGVISALIFRYARRGHPLAVVCYGFILYATLMSVFAEEFFARMDLYGKSALVVVLLYFVGPKLFHPLFRKSRVKRQDSFPIGRLPAEVPGERHAS